MYIRTRRSMDDVMTETKTERLNLRLSSEALATVREAASLQQQDLTSFILGAALERARAILTEERLLRLTPHEVNQIERALDADAASVPQLAALLRRHGAVAPSEVPAATRAR